MGAKQQSAGWVAIHNGSNGEHVIRQAGPRGGLVATVWCGIEPDAEAEQHATMIAAAPAMATTLQRAARILSELPPEQQDARMIALRNEIVECIKQATPDYYGLTSGEVA